MDFQVENVVESNLADLRIGLCAAKVCKDSVETLKIKETEEIGDGNLNLVYRVMLTTPTSDDEECSVIVKYAPPFIKCLGPSYPLTQDRLSVEYSALEVYHKLSPGSVPVPLHFNCNRNTVFMEDLKGWKILRNELIDGRVDVEAIKRLMTSVAVVHNSSSKSVYSDHTQLCKTFSNEDMVGVTEQYVFSKPFANADPTNKHDPLLNEEVEQLRADKKSYERAEKMRKLFVECHDCLCHGDLHTGSVMVKDGQCKMFDMEFALMGPASFDFGMFLANLLMVLIRHHVLNNVGVVAKIREAIATCIQQYMSTATIGEKDVFIRNTCGFIGIEMIRRVIGAAHIEDLALLPHGELKSLVLGRAFLSTTAVCDGNLETIIKKTIEDNLN